MISKIKDQKHEIRQNMRDGNGTVSIDHYINKENFNSKVRLCARLELPPGASIGIHEHQNEDEIYIIVQGSGILNDGISTETVNEGDAILTGHGEQHSLCNNGDVPLILTAVIIQY